MPRRFGAAGCRYLDDRLRQCGATVQQGSPYCPEHHALCYLPRSSPIERRRLREIDRIGAAVGGRQAARETASAMRKFMRKVAAIDGQATRDVAPGESWAFHDHRTLAEVIADEGRHECSGRGGVQRPAGDGTQSGAYRGSGRFG
jgi:hypothetical protein